MIKGHAVIELKDVKTGEVQRVEHDNMVTNGIKYAMTPWLGKFSFANTKGENALMEEKKENRMNNNASIMDHLLGGIFLFQNSLEEDVDNVTFPTNNPLTGKASRDAYSGMDTYRGSYNEQESGLQEDGSYRKVWDFATNQANGQISALSLTTYKGGVCGCGYKEWDYNTETPILTDPFFYLGTIKQNIYDARSYMDPIVRLQSNEVLCQMDDCNFDYNNNYRDRHLSVGKKIWLRKRKFPITAISPFYDFYNQYIEEDVEVGIPEEFASYAANCNCGCKASESYRYIYKKTNIAAGETIKILRIKTSDLSSDIITFTNSTSEIIQDLYYSVFTDRHIFFITVNTRNIYCADITTGDIERVIENWNCLSYIFMELDRHIYVCSISSYSDYRDKRDICINEDTLEVKFHPGIVASTKLYERYRQNIDMGATKISPATFVSTRQTQQNLKYMEVYLSANTLMTINNLPSPVVKTAAQTMKVTYTIQETDQ